MGTRIQLAESTLTDSILNCFFTVYRYFGPGLSEEVYMNSLEIELRDRGHQVSREVHVPVYYNGRRAGRHRLDMVVDDKVIVEGKIGDKLLPNAESRTTGYVRITKFEVALLLHFGPKPQFQRIFVQNRDKTMFRQITQRTPIRPPAINK